MGFNSAFKGLIALQCGMHLPVFLLAMLFLQDKNLSCKYIPQRDASKG